MDSADLYIKLVIAEQQKAKDKTIATIKDLIFSKAIEATPEGSLEKREKLDYRNLLNDVEGSRKAKRIRRLSGSPKKTGQYISFLPDNVQELKNHLQKLLSAAKGHSNVYSEGMAVLNLLLEKGEINKAEFLRLAKSFS